ncbi:hypothetical protein D3C84_795250 [compost metagenome]
MLLVKLLPSSRLSISVGCSRSSIATCEVSRRSTVPAGIEPEVISGTPHRTGGAGSRGEPRTYWPSASRSLEMLNQSFGFMMIRRACQPLVFMAVTAWPIASTGNRVPTTVCGTA